MKIWFFEPFPSTFRKGGIVLLWAVIKTMKSILALTQTVLILIASIGFLQNNLFSKKKNTIFRRKKWSQWCWDHQLLHQVLILHICTKNSRYRKHPPFARRVFSVRLSGGSTPWTDLDPVMPQRAGPEPMGSIGLQYEKNTRLPNGNWPKNAPNLSFFDDIIQTTKTKTSPRHHLSRS